MTHYKNTRFHPNLYENGKVCLSILGTWSGPGWTKAMSIQTVIITIQSLMDEHPMVNEPGHEKDIGTEHEINYNYGISYMNIKCTIHQLSEWITQVKEKAEFINPFGRIMQDYFLKNFDLYITSLEKLQTVNMKTLSTMWATNSIKIDIDTTKKELNKLKTELETIMK